MATKLTGKDGNIYLRAGDNKHQAGSVSQSALTGPAASGTITLEPTDAATNTIDLETLLTADTSEGVDFSELSKDERIAAAEKILIDSVANMQNSEDFTRALDFAAKIHNYSMVNTFLLMTEHGRRASKDPDVPADPGHFASYNKWKGLGRTVKKGAKGYPVWTPIISSGRYYEKDGKSIFLKKGEKAPAGATVKTAKGELRGFSIGFTFPAYLTEGDPIPEPPRPQLLEGGGIEGLTETVETLIWSSGYSIERVPASELGGANGSTNPKTKVVQVRDDVDEAQAQKTLLHEFGHISAGHCDDEFDYVACRGFAEVQAEAAAYLTVKTLNPDADTEKYSVPYLAGWSHGMGQKEMKSAINKITTISKSVVEHFHSVHGEPAEADKTAEAQPATPTVADHQLRSIRGKRPDSIGLETPRQAPTRPRGCALCHKEGIKTPAVSSRNGLWVCETHA